MPVLISLTRRPQRSHRDFRSKSKAAGQRRTRIVSPPAYVIGGKPVVSMARLVQQKFAPSLSKEGACSQALGAAVCSNDGSADVFSSRPEHQRHPASAMARLVQQKFAPFLPKEGVCSQPLGAAVRSNADSANLCSSRPEHPRPPASSMARVVQRKFAPFLPKEGVCSQPLGAAVRSNAGYRHRLSGRPEYPRLRCRFYVFVSAG